MTLSDLDGLAEQALNRIDEKGDSIADAVEAVTGGNPALDRLVVLRLRGESVPLAVLTAAIRECK